MKQLRDAKTSAVPALLHKALDALKADKEVVLAAVAQYAHALEYAAAELKQG